MNLSLFSAIAFVAWAAAVAVCDCRSRRVPNMLVAGGLLLALACSAWHAGPLRVGPLQALEGMAAGCAALLPFFLLRVMGAADVKVFAVLGAWCGLFPLIGLWVAASLAAGVHALVLLVGARQRLARFKLKDDAAADARHGTPYAACLTVPAIALALQTAFGGALP